MLLARAGYVVAIAALLAGFVVIGLAAQAPRAAARGPVGGSITPATRSVLAAPTTAHTGGIHVYDALVVARVHVRAASTVDLAPTLLGDLPEGTSRSSVRALWASTTPGLSVVATNTADDIVGLADDYIDITAKGSRVRNVQTSVGRSSFEQNLIDAGYQPTAVSPAKNVVSYELNGTRYVVRDAATSTGGPTADSTCSADGNSTMGLS
jgi:hypothetical protein